MNMESNGREKYRQQNHSFPMIPLQKEPELQGLGSSSSRPPHASSNTLNSPTSELEVSSVVNDLGDAKQLAQTRDRGHQRSANKTGVLVSHARIGLKDTAIQPDSIESDALYQSRVSQLKDENATTSPKTSQKLGRKIRVALMTSSWEKEGKSFLPIDELDHIIDREPIYNELKRQRMDPALVNDIWEEKGSASSLTTRRKLFAILVLIGQVPTIIDFIDDGLYDSDLPFLFKKGTGDQEGSYDVFRKVTKPNGKPEKRTEIKFFKQWEEIDLESFSEKQWQLLAPYFELVSENNPRVSHYNLGSHTILPFIEDHIVDEPPAQHGGSADVRRVKIHHAHQDLWTLSDKDENPSYAIKRLHSSDKKAFEHEVEILKRFSGNNKHQHLISLLLTYHYREQYHLLFHWADGNLLDFCKRSYPNPENPIRNSKFAKWVCGQLLGVVEGLQAIQTYTSDSSHSRNYGRHGDLKPENILWFKGSHSDQSSSDDLGSFVISDFGLTTFHRKESKSAVNPETLGRSHTYRPPEYDVLKEVSQKCDIWSLGCVLLEFLHWYLFGWKGVEKFQSSRMADGDNPDMSLDDYFNFFEYDSSQKGTRLKKSVQDAFICLRDHKGTDPFFLKVLNFVQNKLLRMEPTKRAGCGEIVNFFKTLNENCPWDDQYPGPFPKPRRTSTNLSELIGPGLSSPRDEIRRSLDMPLRSRPKNRFVDLVKFVIAQNNGGIPSTDTSEAIVLDDPATPILAEDLEEDIDTNTAQDVLPNFPRKVHFEAKESLDSNDLRTGKSDGGVDLGQTQSREKISNSHDEPERASTILPPRNRKRISPPHLAPVN